MDRVFPFQGNCSKDVSRKIENNIRGQVNTFSTYNSGGMLALHQLGHDIVKCSKKIRNKKNFSFFVYH